MLVVSVAVNAWYTMPRWFNHAPWEGVHPVDLVFPTFVTLSGCGLAFAYRRRVPVGPTVRRFVVLLAFGLLYNAHAQVMTKGGFDAATLRWTGVLQLYAVVVLVVALLHLVAKRWWAWLLITLVLAAAQVALLRGYAAAICPDSMLTPTCNPSLAIDPAFIPLEHLYFNELRGADPEGVVAILGALISTSAGATAGHLMTDRSMTGRGRVLAAAGTLATLSAAAWAASTLVPTMKRLWTASFALSVSVAICAVLLLLYVALDRRELGRVGQVATYPLVALGRNSLLVYFGSHVLMLTLLLTIREGTNRGWHLAIANWISVAGQPVVTFVCAAVLAWTLLAMVLHSRRIYLRP